MFNFVKNNDVKNYLTFFGHTSIYLKSKLKLSTTMPLLNDSEKIKQ